MDVPEQSVDVETGDMASGWYDDRVDEETLEIDDPKIFEAKLLEAYETGEPFDPERHVEETHAEALRIYQYKQSHSAIRTLEDVEADGRKVVNLVKEALKDENRQPKSVVKISKRRNYHFRDGFDGNPNFLEGLNEALASHLFLSISGGEATISSYTLAELFNIKYSHYRSSGDGNICSLQSSEKDGMVVISLIDKISDANLLTGRAIFPSDMVYLTLFRSLGGKKDKIAKINYVGQEYIINEETFNIVSKIIPVTREIAPTTMGDHENITTIKKYSKSVDEQRAFHAIMGTKNMKLVERMLAQHSEAFQGKETTDIHIWFNPDCEDGEKGTLHWITKIAQIEDTENEEGQNKLDDGVKVPEIDENVDEEQAFRLS